MDSIVPPQFQPQDPNQSQQPAQPQQPQSQHDVEEFDDIIAPVTFFDDAMQRGLSARPLQSVPEQIVESAVESVEEVVSEPTFEPVAAPVSELSSFVEPEPEPAPVISESKLESATEPFAEAPTEKVSYADSSIQELNISDIVANPYQPRTQFKQEALEELASSIREHGVIQPLVVTKATHGYEIVVGERRFRASQLAGLTKIPAIVKGSLHDQTKLEVALIENTQRQDLNAIEEARGYDRMIKEFNLTQDQVAKKVGKSRSAVANTLRLLNLPAEIQRGVIEGKITEGHARAILGLPDIEKMILMYQTVLDQGWNVRQVEAKVREIAVKRRIDAATPDPKLMAIETELRGKLGTQVKIQRQGRGGKITIDFFSDEDLEDIIQKIAEQKSAEQDNYFTV